MTNFICWPFKKLWSLMKKQPPKAKTIAFSVGGQTVKTFSMLTTDKGLQVTAFGLAADEITPAPLLQPSPGQDLLWQAGSNGIVAVEEVPGSLLCNFTPLAAGTVTITCSGNSLTGGAAVSGQFQIVVSAPAPPPPPVAASIDFTAAPLS